MNKKFNHNFFFAFFAFLAGVLLALMILINAKLSDSTNPIWSSFVAHGIGSLVAVIFLIPIFQSSKKRIITSRPHFWNYTGGAVGALTVVLANITVSSPIGLIGTISLMILGQTLFGLIVDLTGWFDMKKRTLSNYDLLSLVLITSGSILILFYSK